MKTIIAISIAICTFICGLLIGTNFNQTRPNLKDFNRYFTELESLAERISGQPLHYKLIKFGDKYYQHQVNYNFKILVEQLKYSLR